MFDEKTLSSGSVLECLKKLLWISIFPVNFYLDN
ncbi:uncharacterized protein METZ01_LOCUS104482 [marine metagenome]|uniref:Uncharacterized protein n=1 Tax=marine metagenome TaxID=408172 RepID=A0A381WHP5_9ZZZZ